MTKTITLEADAVAEIRKMLMICLAAYGEVLRPEDACETQKLCGMNIPQSMLPREPTGEAETVSDFANVLRLSG